jgi:hypothetical protein
VTGPTGNLVASTSAPSQALQFSGVNQYVDLGNPSNLDISGDITLEAWIKPGSTGGLQDIIAHGYQFNPDAEVFLRIANGEYQVGSWTGSTTAYAGAAIAAADVGQWVHLAGVYKGSEWQLYRDGVLVATSGSASQGAVQVTQTNWAIGAQGGGGGRFFQGQIADAHIWDTGRTAAEVVSDMATAIPANQPFLVADYAFNESGGTTVFDATGYQNNGTLGGSNPANAPTRVADIAPGSVLTFTPPDSGTYTVTVTATGVNGGSATTSTTVSAFDVAPTPSITGLAGGSTPVGSPISLSASASDPASAVNAAGYQYLWQATNAAGQTSIAGSDLVLTGNNPVTLPSGLINGATSALTIQVSFQTTHGGVLLGYQNAALGSTPSNWVPALYVGTDGRLYGEIFDGTLPLHSTAVVADGTKHVVELSYANGVQSLYLDGTLVGTLTGSLQPLDMSFDELGTGWTTNWQADTGGLDPFIGTIQSVQIANSSAAVGTWSFPGTGGSQASFTPFDIGTDTISLLATDKNGGTGVTSAPLTVTEVAPTAAILGLPATNVVVGTPITLTSSISSPSPVATAAGFNQVWQVTGSAGTTIAGKALSFNGNNPLTLASNLFDTTTVTINISFQTTTKTGGVLLGYQNAPFTQTPQNGVPVLYVGTDGRLYAQLFEINTPTVPSGEPSVTVKAINPIKSTLKVNDGVFHDAELIVSGTTQTLILDGVTVGTLTGNISAVPAAFIQLGTGYTAGWAGGTIGYDPFVGTMGAVQITTGSPPAGILSFPGAGGNEVIFIAPDPETFTISLRASDKNGGNGVTKVSVTATG